MRFEEDVTVTITLPAFKLEQAFMVDEHHYQLKVCRLCGWHSNVMVGDDALYEPNPQPHTCPVGIALSEKGL
jgi:hypothetical protein